MEILALAHFQLALNQDERFRPMVQAAFWQNLSGETYPTYLSTTLSPEGLGSVLQP
jgi:hypothetical protein